MTHSQSQGHKVMRRIVAHKHRIYAVNVTR